MTGTAGTWTGIGNSTSYQWQASTNGTTFSDIAGATSLTYAITAGEVGSFLRLLVTVTNPEGAVSAASNPTARVVSSPPLNSVKPAITGTVQRASTLTASQGTWSGIGNDYGYQWQRDGVNVAGATGTSYELTVADVGTKVRVVVTATNADGFVAAASNATVTVPSSPPANTSRPAISGIAKRGSTLTGTNGNWSGISNGLAYQWQRSSGTSWVDIDGATGATYALTTADVGATVRLFVTATNPEGSASAASNPTATVAGDGPVNTIAPTISGSAQRAAVLTSAPGTWSGNANTYSFQWQRGTVDIAGATDASYELTAADVGTTVRLVVTATNPDGSASRASAPSAIVRTAPPVNTALPVATGAALRSTTLSASQGTWTGPSLVYAYQWQRDSGAGYADVAGATGTTYLLGVADVGKRIRVRVTATNADAAVTASSIGSSLVLAGPPYALSAPAISGTARRTATLTSTLGNWGGIENDYAYQWQRDGVNIAGATGTSYTLTAADVGARVRLRVTATNLDGTASATSAATSVVATAPPRDGVPTVSGPAKVGGVLTAATGTWTPDGASFAYVWQRDGVDIAGATSPTYTLQPADSGRRVRVKVTATNVDGSTSATSASTDQIAAAPGEHRRARPRRPERRRRRSPSRRSPARGTPPGMAYSYAWVRCAADATGCEDAGTGSTYTLSAADVGKRLGVRVTATSARRRDHRRERPHRHGRATRAGQHGRARRHRQRLRRRDPERRRGPLVVPVARRRLPVAARQRRHPGRDRLDLHPDGRRRRPDDRGPRHGHDARAERDREQQRALDRRATRPAVARRPARQRRRGACPHAHRRPRHVGERPQPLQLPVAALRCGLRPDRRRRRRHLPADQAPTSASP